MKRLIIAVLDDVPDNIVPTLVAHSVINAHIKFEESPIYQDWLQHSFRKVVLRVNVKEFKKIRELDIPKHEGYENKTLDGEISCVVLMPMTREDSPNVINYAKLWQPK